MAANRTRTVLISTLGGKSQVVTFALDLLLRQHRAEIDAVYVLHFSRLTNPRIDLALQKLEYDFKTSYPGIAFTSVDIMETLSGFTRPIAESDDSIAAHAVWMTAHRLFMALRETGKCFHLCITGGPRLIALQTLSVATLLFAPHDHCWHLFTPESVRKQAGDGAVLHLDDYDAAGLQLIDVPLLPVSLLMPGLQIAASQSPEQIIAERSQWIETTETRRCSEVMGRLTPKQREVLREFSRDHADTESVMRHMQISDSTLDSHRRAVLAECRVAWGLDDTARLTRHFLREKFGRLPESFWGEWVRKKRV